jgi:NAD(P)-dependent dehydrogenase (short-subunit alcohol dehydrogenase family)
MVVDELRTRSVFAGVGSNLVRHGIMPDLNGKIAVVTGTSRGVGRGVALELAQAGVIVYATGRTVSREAFTRDEIIPVRCDHTHDEEVEAAFRRVFDERERLDILVNNV